MASNGTIAHRFANRDYNFERGLKGSSVHIDGKNYYSYSTVFGQWVDEKVCLVYHGETSITSHKHMLWDSLFPKDVTLFPYDDGGSSYYYGGGYHGCNLVGWGSKFDYEHRVRLMDYWVGEIYDALNAMVDGKQKDLDKYAERVIEEYWAYVEKLCSLYKDTTIPKWLKKKRIDMDGTWKAKKVIVRALYKEERDVRVLVDAAFGQGTYKKYYDYCARYRKAEDKKAQMSWLCSRLGIANPYEKWQRDVLSHDMKADDIRKLSAKERNELHFRALAYKEWKSKEDGRKAKYEKNRLNAYKWIVGCEPTYSTSWGGYKHYDDKVVTCKNMYTGEVYDLSGDHIFGFYWATTNMQFKYDDFRKSENKEEWLRKFYTKCKEAQDNRKAISILKSVEATTKEKKYSFEDDVYVLDEKLTGIGMDAESLRVVTEFIARQDKHYADEAARERAREIERQRAAEEKRREEEFQKQVKQEQIDECVARGIEGCRDLWRKHLDEVYNAARRVAGNNGDFFMGGNVLLRFNLDKTYVESSKGVRVPVAVAKAWFRKVKQWHDDPKSFKPMEWNTKGNGTYMVSEYKDDILTAGCHDISYTEMERMYNQILAECA